MIRWLLFFGAGMAFGAVAYYTNMSLALFAIIWVAVAFVLATLYAYRYTLRKNLATHRLGLWRKGRQEWYRRRRGH